MEGIVEEPLSLVNPTPFTLHPTPKTQNPKPKTPTPKPQTQTNQTQTNKPNQIKPSADAGAQAGVECGHVRRGVAAHRRPAAFGINIRKHTR